MTNMKPFLAIILCTLVTASISLLPVSHCRTVQPNDDNLIEETCKKTTNHDLCVKYLKADPGSSGADVYGLGVIMAEEMRTKANNALDKIHKLLKGSPEPGMKGGLNACLNFYDTVLNANVAEAIGAFKGGDPKFAEHAAYDCTIEVKSCETSFPDGKSQLTNENRDTHDVAVLVGDIARQLL